MKMLRRRRVLAVVLSLTAAVGGLLVSGTAHAQIVTTGSLSFNGDSGDYITQGKSYSYSTANGDALDVSSSNGSTISISVKAYNGDWWTLSLDAPGTPDRPVPGQSAFLVPGTYSNAHRYPFNGTGPGLDLSGDGRGCNTLTGSFTVTNAVFGPQGYVQSFDATFEQHCEGATPAARGKVHISNAPPPAQAAPKPTKVASPKTAATTPRAGSTGPHASPTGPHATAGNSGTATAGGGDTATNTSAVPVAVANAFHTRSVLIRVGIVAWIVLAIASLVTIGVLVAVRPR